MIILVCLKLGTQPIGSFLCQTMSWRQSVEATFPAQSIGENRFEVHVSTSKLWFQHASQHASTCSNHQAAKQIPMHTSPSQLHLTVLFFGVRSCGANGPGRAFPMSLLEESHAGGKKPLDLIVTKHTNPKKTQRNIKKPS